MRSKFTIQLRGWQLSDFEDYLGSTYIKVEK